MRTAALRKVALARPLIAMKRDGFSRSCRNTAAHRGIIEIPEIAKSRLISIANVAESRIERDARAALDNLRRVFQHRPADNNKWIDAPRLLGIAAVDGWHTFSEDARGFGRWTRRA